jgi:hypothetical protein
MTSLLYSKSVLKFNLVDNKIYLDTSINGIPCTLLYDTGAFGFTLDSDFVENNNLLSKSSTRIVEFKIGEFRKEIKGYNVLKYQKYYQASFQGVLGINFFEKYIVEIDYLNSVLILYGKDDELPLNYESLNSKHNLNSFTLYGLFFTKLNLKFNDSINFVGDFLIDTGSSRTITVFNLPEIKLNMGKNIKISRSGASFYGFEKSLYFKVKEILFSNAILNNVIIDYSENNSVDLKTNNIIGIIGGGFLKKYNLIINYSQSEIKIKENGSTNDSTTELITDGFDISKTSLKQKKIIVTSIVDSTIFNQEIKLKDEILEINQVEAEQINWDAIKQLKKTLGAKIEYKVKREKKILFINTEVIQLF